MITKKNWPLWAWIGGIVLVVIAFFTMPFVTAATAWLEQTVLFLSVIGPIAGSGAYCYRGMVYVSKRIKRIDDVKKRAQSRALYYLGIVIAAPIFYFWMIWLFTILMWGNVAVSQRLQH